MISFRLPISHRGLAPHTITPMTGVHRHAAAFRRLEAPPCRAGQGAKESSCGVERVPWGDGKEHLTTSYRWFLARWAKRLS